MLRTAAISWVQANCPNPALNRDVVRALQNAERAGDDCFFLFGAKLTKKNAPFLLHCFADEVFIFQLTEAQAVARGLDLNAMGSGRNSRAIPTAASPLVINIDRFELKDAAIGPTQPLVGRIQYEVLADGGGDYAVRLDYAVGPRRRTAWDYPQRPLWGKGMLDLAFPAITLDAVTATDFKGPLALFATLVQKVAGRASAEYRPISNTAATIVEVV